MALPHGAVGWSAVCDCLISWSYLLFSMIQMPIYVLEAMSLLSVTSHIKCVVAHCLINVVYLRHVPLSSHDNVALFE